MSRSQNLAQARGDHAAGGADGAPPGIVGRPDRQRPVGAEMDRRCAVDPAPHRRPPGEPQFRLRKGLAAEQNTERTGRLMLHRYHRRRVYHRAVRLVLASRSPRRSHLLRDAGYRFDVVPADVDERRLPDEPPREYVVRLARAKAAAVASRAGASADSRTIVAADTIVVIDGEVLGKPAERRESAAMLGRLAGRTHEVLTGLAVAAGGQVAVAVETTRVTFAPLDPDRIAWYVATGEGDDKAGAYGVQGLGSRFVERIEGSYTNVVGLPVARLEALLRELAETVSA